MTSQLLEGLASWLDTVLDLVDYQPTTVGGDCFIEHLPDSPDAAVALFQYAGSEADTKLPYDEPSVQLMVRAGGDPTVSRDRAQGLYDAMHGAGPVTLPNGLYVVDLIAVQSGPVALGQDDNRRHRHTVNLRVEFLNPDR